MGLSTGIAGLTRAWRLAKVFTMITAPMRDSHPGKHIRDICGNACADDSGNRCAHFVSRALGIGFGDLPHAGQRQGAGGQRADAGTVRPLRMAMPGDASAS
jgi:hypothetical protein